MKRQVWKLMTLLVLAGLLAAVDGRVQSHVKGVARVTVGSSLVSIEGPLLENQGPGLAAVMALTLQPGRVSTYEDMFAVCNIQDKPLKVWYTLEGDLLELHQESGFSGQEPLFSVLRGSQEKWLPGPEHQLVLPGHGADTVHFYFEVPSDIDLEGFEGTLTVHAEIEGEEPVELEEIFIPAGPLEPY